MESLKRIKPKYKILVLGMTGSGKTTTINIFLNLAMSQKYSDPRLVAIAQVLSFQVKETFYFNCNFQELIDTQWNIQGT
jgi:Flp pilus assembly CpaF family ATPase